MNPSSSTARRAVVLAGAAAFVNLYATQSLLPLLRAWMGAGAAQAGLVVSAGTLGVALAAPFAGFLADRVGRRRLIVLAAFLAVLPGLAAPLAQSAWQLIAARFAQGLFLPAIFAVTVAYIGSEWPPRESRAVTSLYVAGTIGGGFLGRFTSGVVAEFSGWRWALAALALLQLLLALAIRAWLPPERAPSPPARSPWLALRQLLARPEIRGVYGLGFVILFALVGGFTYVTLRLAESPFSLGPAALSLIFAVYLIGMTITSLAGRLLNRYGHRAVLAQAWALAALGLALTLSHGLPAVIAGLALFSAGLFVAQAGATSFVTEAAGALRGPAVGLYVTCYYAGGSVGGVLPAPFWERAGWPAVVALLVLCGALSVAAAWRSLRLPPPAVEDTVLEAGGEAP